ncbi:hypothetical protein [Martelella alba]|uniref:Uncharacterized protein n=1 Tax=Martelella alba TaxID=2590451 RepID=A0ABY2SN42_9HYPH|nr:hypothetical protein [Martelella alba]TKI06852.1 hypothetical protein FCN80_07795 [Martelella alba]
MPNIIATVSRENTASAAASVAQHNKGPRPQAVHNSPQTCRRVGAHAGIPGSPARGDDMLSRPVPIDSGGPRDSLVSSRLSPQNTALPGRNHGACRTMPISAPQAGDAVAGGRTTADAGPIKPVMADAPRPACQATRMKTVMQVAVKTAALAVAVTAVLMPIAAMFGIPVGMLSLVQMLAVGVGIAAGVYTVAGPDRFALLMDKILPKTSTHTQSIAGASVGLVSAGVYRASGRGKAIASVAGYYSVKKAASLAGFGDSGAAGLAGANAAGAAIGTVDRLAGGKANMAIHTGAAVGGVIGGWALGRVDGSARVGETAGAGAYYGAGWGKRLDDYAAAIIANPWRLFLGNAESQDRRADSLFMTRMPMASSIAGDDGGEPARYHRYPAFTDLAHGQAAPRWTSGRAEKIAAMTGGVSGGLYAAADIHCGGNLSQTAGAAGVAYHTLSFGKLVLAARNYLNDCAVFAEQGQRRFALVDNID